MQSMIFDYFIAPKIAVNKEIVDQIISQHL